MGEMVQSRKEDQHASARKQRTQENITKLICQLNII